MTGSTEAIPRPVVAALAEQLAAFDGLRRTGSLSIELHFALGRPRVLKVRSGLRQDWIALST